MSDTIIVGSLISLSDVDPFAPVVYLTCFDNRSSLSELVGTGIEDFALVLPHSLEASDGDASGHVTTLVAAIPKSGASRDVLDSSACSQTSTPVFAVG